MQNNALITPGRYPGQLHVRGIGDIQIESWDVGMIYDTVTIEPTSGTTLAGGSEFVFFRDIQNKTYLRTNMTLSSQLPVGWELIILHIGIHIPANVARTDALAILRYGYVEFVLDNTAVFRQGPATSFPSGYGLWGTMNVSSTGAVEDSVYGNGLPSAGIPYLSLPIRLTDKRTFRGMIKFFEDVTLSASDVDIPVTMYLDGLLKMPVQ